MMHKMHLREIADLVGGELLGDDVEITGAAGLEDAGAGDLTFVNRASLLPQLATSAASAVLLGPGMETDRPAIRCENPYRAFAKMLEFSLPNPDRVFPPGIHPTAVVAADAQVAAASVGPYCVIGAGTTVGEGTRLGAHVALGPDVTVGCDCQLYAQVTVREGCRLGDRVVLQAGVVIGTEGFGYLPGPAGLERIPQVGTVLIEDDVEIGANSCIDRATTGLTVVGAGTKIDNQIQIGHNVKVGRHCALSAQSGISGSCTLGDGVTMGGQVGIADHVTIGDGVKVGAKSGIMKDVEPGDTVFGVPALDVKETFRITGAMRRLPDLLRRVARLENLENLEDLEDKDDGEARS
ncbi:MAG: UDP-3-O-(3-hydroxymyristoyl)glucosamine N-acyltransferase [bacterium]|nr:UDP-3-O-(3-hydroxymyristoyl)glucosamine N-acyltransferase [bacterium]